MTVELVEVGPRDGLQNEPHPIPVARKIALVDQLSCAGFRRIEVASFVSPAWVPQMAGSAEVLAGIRRVDGVRYGALTPNMRGLEDAIAARADEVAVFASASEGFSRANINASIAESLDRYGKVLDAAGSVGLPVRGYVSCVIACPFDGPTRPDAVLQVARRLLDMGCYEISLGDTIGAGRADTTAALLQSLLADVDPGHLAGHFHDTGGHALENIDVAHDMGLRVFDTAIGGLGGCPYAPGAPGNVATEAVADHFAARGIATGLDRAALTKAAGLAHDMKGGTDV